MARKLTDTVRINLRFSEALRRRIERAATANKRSINDEIVSRVIESLATEGQEALIGTALDKAMKRLGDEAMRAGFRAGQKARRESDK
jgi:Arc-like DNA binding domain